MQITIYLSEQMIEDVEALAAKTEKSRSAVIQEILAEGLEKRMKGTASTEILRFFGSWKMSPRETKEIRRVSGKDVRRARLQ